MEFGTVIADARKKANLSQKELAALIKKDDGQPISPQYLNDIERNRRNPPSNAMIVQLAEHLGLQPEVLYYLTGELPEDLRGARVEKDSEKEKVVRAYQAFRRELKK